MMTTKTSSPRTARKATRAKKPGIKGSVLYVPIGGAAAAEGPNPPLIAVLNKPEKTSAYPKKVVNTSDNRDFLIRAGILDANGELKSIFRSEASK